MRKRQIRITENVNFRKILDGEKDIVEAYAYDKDKKSYVKPEINLKIKDSDLGIQTY